MSIIKSAISDEQANKILAIKEGQFSDLKSKRITPAKLTRTISAFANSDGGDLYIGIEEEEAGATKTRIWDGFINDEAANGHLQIFEQLFPLGSEFQYEFLEFENQAGIVLHVQVNKAKLIIKDSGGTPYLRRGAQNLPVNTPEALKNLEYSKGISSFETQTIADTPVETITTSQVIQNFITEVVPTTDAQTWLKKQLLIRKDMPTVAGVLLFADEPQALVPKHCGVKIYRYKTNEQEGFRDALAFDPITIEGSLYSQIMDSVRVTTEVVETIPRLGNSDLVKINYPNTTLHEIITNALIHRDYSVADDVHIRIFDNRIEIQSPGRLPAHMTVINILEERFARNGAVVRILNKFPNPPNKDVGEGLNTAFEAMHSLGLKAPVIIENENTVLVVIKHEQLASAEESILSYLEKNESINNSTARHICHIPRDYQVKIIFGKMVANGLLEQVPGTNTSSTAYQKKQK